MSKIGFVLEGGAARGIYTAGVLDVLLENGIMADGVMGVSAGAIHGISYVAGQAGRSYCFSTKYCKDSRFMSFRSFLKTGDICGAQFCYYDIPERLVPFATQAFESSRTEYYCVCTDVETGLPVYHKSETMRGNEIEWVRASASMPLVSRTVEINGMKLLDGGVSDSIPFRAFQRMGYDKMLVVCTQHDGYRKKADASAKLMSLRYKAFPDFVQTMNNRPKMYNEQLDDLKTAERLNEVIVIRPSQPLEIGRIEHDPAVIRSVYLLGRADAERKIEEIKSYFS